MGKQEWEVLNYWGSPEKFGNRTARAHWRREVGGERVGIGGLESVGLGGLERFPR